MDLKQYFSNDQHCCFDELVRKGPLSNQDPLALITSGGNDGASSLLENSDTLSDIPDYVRHFWLPTCDESGLPPLLTMPGVQITDDQIKDTIEDVVVAHLGNDEVSLRKVLRADDVTQDERGLRLLISNGCYRAAVSLTSRLLAIYGQGFGRFGQPTKHSPHSLQLWFTRLALLIKLSRYEVLEAEAAAFDNLRRRDVYFDFYPSMYSDKKGCMASFALRLLLAAVPVYTKRPKEALDVLTEIAEVCKEVKNYFKLQNPMFGEFWRKREIKVLCIIINCAIGMQDYGLVDDVLSKILRQSDTNREEKRSLLAACGRIYLLAGDVFGAEFMFAEARRLNEKHSANESVDIIDKGLVAIAQNDFLEAYANFHKALLLDPSNILVLNNLGVCQLYSGKLKNAICWFEKSIDTDLPNALNEHLLINLATLYELQSNTSREKKLNLLRRLNLFKPDLSAGLDICLKLQSSF